MATAARAALSRHRRDVPGDDVADAARRDRRARRRCGGRRAETVVIESGTDPGSPTIRLGGVDVSREIRSGETNASREPGERRASVRELLVDQQRAIIGAGGIVVEGRDIGTVVAPDAALKVYLTRRPVGPGRATRLPRCSGPGARRRRRRGRARPPRPYDSVAGDRPADGGRRRGADRHHGPDARRGDRAGRRARPRAGVAATEPPALRRTDVRAVDTIPSSDGHATAIQCAVRR